MYTIELKTSWVEIFISNTFLFNTFDVLKLEQRSPFFWRQHSYLLDIIKQVLILCRLWQFSYIFPILCEVSSFDYHNILLLMTFVIPKKHHHFLSLDNFWLRLTVIAWEVSIGPLFTTSQHSLQYPDIYVNRTSLLILLQQCNDGEQDGCVDNECQLLVGLLSSISSISFPGSRKF